MTTVREGFFVVILCPFGGYVLPSTIKLQASMDVCWASMFVWGRVVYKPRYVPVSCLRFVVQLCNRVQ